MTKELSELEPLGPLVGSGGQADVYSIEGSDGLLLKRYKRPDSVNRASLDRLIDWRKSLSQPDKDFIDARTSWPQECVVSSGQTVGVVIPQAPANFVAGLVTGEKPRELQFLFLPDRASEVGVRSPAPATRARIVRDLAALLDFFAKRSIAHGDVSMKNVLWDEDPGPGAHVYCLDCDGVMVAGHPPALPSVATEEWVDPRFTSGKISAPDPSSDVYALSLAFYRCYYAHRGFVGLGDAKLNVPKWPPSNPEVLDLLSASLSRQGSRPTAERWVEVLTPFAERLAAEGITDVDRPLQSGAGDGPALASPVAPVTQRLAPPTQPVGKAIGSQAAAPPATPISQPEPKASPGPSRKLVIVLACVLGLVVGAVAGLLVSRQVFDGEQQSLVVQEAEIEHGLDR